jgi:uncharacterized protein YdcH (DUF465 family)
MERQDLELIESLANGHDELRHLWTRHQDFERDLARLNGVRNPSDDERRQISNIKRAKLKGKERMQSILDAHRNN